MKLKSICQKILFWILTIAIGQILIACSAGTSGTSGQTQNNTMANESMKITPVASSSPMGKKLRSTGFLASNEVAMTSFRLINDAGSEVQGEINGNNITVKLPGNVIGPRIARFTTNPESAKVYVGDVEQKSDNCPAGRPCYSYGEPITYTVKLADGTNSKNYTVNVIFNTESSNKITSYSLINSQGLQVPGKIDNQNHTIKVDVGAETNLKLKAIFSTTGESVLVNNVLQKSGETVNDFILPVVYTVKAKNGTAESYVVLVTSNSSKRMVSFGLKDIKGNYYKGVFESKNNAIKVAVPYNTDLTNLVAKFEKVGKNVTVGGSVQTSDSSSQDFSNSATKPVVYRVNAIDGSFIEYNVTAVKNLSPENRIESFSINGIVANIQGNSITVNDMPISESLTTLKPVFIASKGSTVRVNSVTGPIQTSGVSVQNFSNPVKYFVIAANESVAEYIVTVNREARNGIVYFYTLYPNSVHGKNDSKIYQSRLDEGSGQIYQLDPTSVDAWGRWSYTPAYTMVYNRYNENSSTKLFTMTLYDYWGTTYYTSTPDRYNIDQMNSGRIALKRDGGDGQYKDGTDLSQFGKIVVSPPINNKQYIYQIFWKYKVLYAGPGMYFPGATPGTIVSRRYFQRFSYDISDSTKGFTAINTDDDERSALGYYDNDIMDMAITKNGKYAYAALGESSVVMYSIDPSNGKLNKLDSSGLQNSGGFYPYEVSVDPSGKYLFVLNGSTTKDSTGPGNIVVYKIAPENGYLTYVSSIQVANVNKNDLQDLSKYFLRRTLVVDPKEDAKKEYIYLNNRDGITTFSINMDSGILTKENTFSLNNFNPAITSADALSVDQNGKYLSVLDSKCNNKVYLFAIDKRNNGKLFQAGQSKLAINGTTECYNSDKAPVTVMIEQAATK